MTVTRIDLGSEYLGGIAKPQTADVGKFAVVRLDSLSRPNLAYETQVASVADDTFATTLAPSLRGVGLTVDSSGNLAPRQRPRATREQEHFISGGTTSGSIGKMGWSLLGVGTPAYSRLDHTVATSTSRATLTTSGAANDTAILCLGDTTGRQIFAPSNVALMQFTSSFNSVTTSKRVFYGLSGDLATEPSSAANALGIYSDSAVNSGRWQIIARSGSAGSPVDTGVAPDSSGAELLTMVQATAGTWVFYVGNIAIGSISSGIPTAPLNLGLRLETLTSAAKSHRTGMIGFEVNNLGAYDDDTFLEA